jgi:hypothetical protein
VNLSATARVLFEVEDERERQDAKFPDQRLPSFPAYRVNLNLEYEMLLDAARGQNDYAEKFGGDSIATWESVLREKFCEAMLERDPAKLRAALIQVAAVSVRWIENIDGGFA